LEIFVDPGAFIYQGAFRIALKVFDWKRWGISMLEFEAVSHS
jgi:hypothetical protein